MSERLVVAGNIAASTTDALTDAYAVIDGTKSVESGWPSLGNAATGYHVDVSPDGAKLAVLHSATDINKLTIIDIASKTIDTSLSISGNLGGDGWVRWSHDGTKLAASDTASPYYKIFDYDGTTFTAQTSLPAIAAMARGLAWSLDDARLALVFVGNPVYKVLDVSSKTLESGWGGIAGVASTGCTFTNDGSKLIISRHNDPRYDVVDVATKTVESGWPALSGNLYDPSMNPDDTLAALPHNNGDKFSIMNMSTKTIESGWPSYSSGGDPRTGAWSPSGDWIAVGFRVGTGLAVINAATKVDDSANWPDFGDDVSGGVTFIHDPVVNINMDTVTAEVTVTGEDAEVEFPIVIEADTAELSLTGEPAEVEITLETTTAELTIAGEPAEVDAAFELAFYDDFDRPNASSWGNNWVHKEISPFIVLDNKRGGQGAVTGSDTNTNRSHQDLTNLGGPILADDAFDITFALDIWSEASEGARVGVGSSVGWDNGITSNPSPQNGYSVRNTLGSIFFEIHKDGTRTAFQQLSRDVQADVWVYRMRRLGGVVQGKFWLPSDPEPVDWMAELSDVDPVQASLDWLFITHYSGNTTAAEWVYLHEIELGVPGPHGPTVGPTPATMSVEGLEADVYDADVMVDTVTSGITIDAPAPDVYEVIDRTVEPVTTGIAVNGTADHQMLVGQVVLADLANITIDSPEPLVTPEANPTTEPNTAELSITGEDPELSVGPWVEPVITDVHIDSSGELTLYTTMSRTIEVESTNIAIEPQENFVQIDNPSNWDNQVSERSSLIHWYRHNELTGTTLVDSKGTKDGFYDGAVSLNQAGIPGTSNRAAIYTTGDARSVIETSITSIGTIELFYKGTDSESIARALMFGWSTPTTDPHGGTHQRFWRLFVREGKVGFTAQRGHYIEGSSYYTRVAWANTPRGSVVTPTNGPVINDNKWHHVVVNHGGLWVDGKKIADMQFRGGGSTNPFSGSGSQKFTIAGWDTSSSVTNADYPLTGTIDEVGVYNASLEGSVIEAHWGLSEISNPNVQVEPAASTITVEAQQNSLTITPKTQAPDVANVGIGGVATTLLIDGALIIGAETAETTVTGQSPSVEVEFNPLIEPSTAEITISMPRVGFRQDVLGYKLVPTSYIGITARDATELEEFNLGPALHTQTRGARFRIGNTSSDAANFTIKAESVNEEVPDMVSFSAGGSWTKELVLENIRPNQISDIITMRVIIPQRATVGKATFILRVEQTYAV